jgi:hypothetical protein
MQQPFKSFRLDMHKRYFNPALMYIFLISMILVVALSFGMQIDLEAVNSLTRGYYTMTNVKSLLTSM